MSFYKRFGKHLKHLRMVKGMTQEELASAADLSPNFIRTVEQGKSGLSFNTIEPVANALGLKPKELFDFE